MQYTVEQIRVIIVEAKQAAKEAATHYLQTVLGGVDQFACGFAWVVMPGIKGNTKLGRTMKEAGISRNYTGMLQLWNPSGLMAQNLACKEAGAEACAEVLQKYGFAAYAESRLD